MSYGNRQIKQFLEKRSYYSEEHVKALAAAAKKEKTPFCAKCCDWHSNKPGRAESQCSS